MSTDTETLLLEFPNQPLWTNVYIQNNARASVPLRWSRVQVSKIQMHNLYWQSSCSYAWIALTFWPIPMYSYFFWSLKTFYVTSLSI